MTVSISGTPKLKLQQSSDTDTGIVILKSYGVDSGVEVASGDANADLRLEPKGSGVVRFGTGMTPIGAETLSGWMYIKDQGGTLRKVGIVS